MRRGFTAIFCCGLLMGFFFLAGARADEMENQVELTGMVTDAAGQPVAGAEVALYRTKNVKKPADFLSAKTAADGRYRLVAPAGIYHGVALLRKSGQKFGPLEAGDKHSGEPLEIDLSTDGDQTFMVMDLREAALRDQKKNDAVVRLSGHIVDEEGHPLAGYYAMAATTKRFKKFPKALSAWSGDDGAYSLFVSPRQYYLGATALYPPASDQLLQQRLVLEKDQDGVDIVVKSE